MFEPLQQRFRSPHGEAPCHQMTHGGESLHAEMSGGRLIQGSFELGRFAFRETGHALEVEALVGRVEEALLQHLLAYLTCEPRAWKQWTCSIHFSRMKQMALLNVN